MNFKRSLIYFFLIHVFLFGVACNMQKKICGVYYRYHGNLYGQYVCDFLDFSIGSLGLDTIVELSPSRKSLNPYVHFLPLTFEKYKVERLLFKFVKYDDNYTRIAIAYKTPDSTDQFTSALSSALNKQSGSKKINNFSCVQEMLGKSGVLFNKLEYNIKTKNKNTVVIEYHIKIQDYILRFLHINQNVNNNRSGIISDPIMAEAARTIMSSFSDSVSSKRLKSSLYDPLLFAGNFFRVESKYNYLETVSLLNKNKKNFCPPNDIDALLAFNEALATYLSFVGDYKNRASATHIAQYPPQLFDEKIITNALLVNAEEYIINQSQYYKALLLNEDHTNPYCRIFAKKILLGLYSKGFRYLAVETVSWQDTAINARKYPIQSSGYYTSEPMFAEFIREALKIGFIIKPYENHDLCSTTKDVSRRQCRENNQAKNLLKIYEADSQAKVFIYAGWGHIQKKITKTGFNPMAKLLADSLGYNSVLSIDQTKFSEQLYVNYDNPFYTYIKNNFNLTHPSVLIKEDRPLILLDTSRAIDLQIIHPKTIYQGSYPVWLLNQGDFIYTSDDKTKYTDCILSLYYWEEVRQEDFEAIPLLNIKLMNESIPTMRLRKGTYVLLIKDRFKEKIYSCKIII